MKFSTLSLLLGIFALAPCLRAQNVATPSASVRASITAEEPAPSAPANPLGLGDMGKDRPKNAKTEITATKEATFDNANGIAIFVGKVIVRDPQMNLTCDKLVVTLNKERKGMQKVEAYGNVVLVHEGQQGEKSVKSIGRSQMAIYDPLTGDLVMTGWPQIQQGINNHISTEESTRMTLNRSGALSTKGGNKTTIVDTSQLDQQQPQSSSNANPAKKQPAYQLQ